MNIFTVLRRTSNGIRIFGFIVILNRNGTITLKIVVRTESYRECLCKKQEILQGYETSSSVEMNWSRIALKVKYVKTRMKTIQDHKKLMMVQIKPEVSRWISSLPPHFFPLIRYQTMEFLTRECSRPQSSQSILPIKKNINNRLQTQKLYILYIYMIK